MDNSIVAVTAIVCVSLVCIVGLLLHRKEGATFKLKNTYKDLTNEISITTNNDQK